MGYCCIFSASTPCTVDTAAAELAGFNLVGLLPSAVPVGEERTVNVRCVGGRVFDYVNGYNSTGRTFSGPITVDCPVYNQGDSRTYFPITEFVCLSKYFFFLSL